MVCDNLCAHTEVVCTEDPAAFDAEDAPEWVKEAGNAAHAEAEVTAAPTHKLASRT